MQNVIQKSRPVLFALIFLGGSIGLLVWMSYGISVFGENLNERIQTIANQNAFDVQYSELVSTVEETKEEREKLNQFVLDGQGDTIALLSQLDLIAAAQGLELSTNELQEVGGAGSFDTLSLRYTFSGPAAAVTRMMHVFETLPYHGHITNVSFNRSNNGDVNANIALLLSIRKHD